MKVQIEISKKGLNMATLLLSQSVDDEKDEKTLEQALQRCNDEVTEVYLDEESLGETKIQLEVCLASLAIGIRAKEIEEGEQ